MSDPFENFDFYIAYPSFGLSMPPSIGREFTRQNTKGPLRGLHVYKNRQLGRMEMTKEEFDRLYPDVLEDFLLIREVRKIPHPLPLIIPKQNPDTVTLEVAPDAVVSVVEPDPAPEEPVVEPTPEPIEPEEPIDGSELIGVEPEVVEPEAEPEVEEIEETPEAETEETDYAELYETGDNIEKDGNSYEILSVDAKIAECFALTAKGKRRVSGGKPVMEEIDLSTI